MILKTYKSSQHTAEIPPRITGRPVCSGVWYVMISGIYTITNQVNGKIYVGQAVSHILNHKKYRPYGHQGRFRCHISEAFSSKKNQSHYLNNAIRKYGVDDFVVELIECCEIEKSDERETHYIKELNSLFPNGYNLKNGGSVFTHSDESKKRLSEGVIRYFEDKKWR